MFDKIIDLDKNFLIYLHGLGSEKWDFIWLLITKQTNWIPVFLVVIYLLFHYLGWKKSLFVLVLMALMITFSDQFTNMIRRTFERLRPINDTSINEQLRILIHPTSFSFTSGHATTSTMVATFVILLLKPYTKHILWFVLFPIFFAYSRLYLGVHFPIDILTGATIGFTLGYLFYKLHGYLSSKIFTS
ncbi:phosphatase PAP2 family protein [Flavicella sediminum]|uniref:phosphatase PAP2 family protein n=1 Tax=Flavicella sediminum TaxID=2585141 RepID=UPI001121E813|nr:phosphatase PAP2 family protein [Flavicella sediminum]